MLMPTNVRGTLLKKNPEMLTCQSEIIWYNYQKIYVNVTHRSRYMKYDDFDLQNS